MARCDSERSGNPTYVLHQAVGKERKLEQKRKGLEVLCQIVLA
jgi:hypothetical protein